MCILSHFSHVQLFVTPKDCSLPGSSVYGVLQAGILEWIVMPSSRDILDPRISSDGSIPGSGRSPREGNGNPLQYSCLENPMDGGA